MRFNLIIFFIFKIIHLYSLKYFYCQEIYHIFIIFYKIRFLIMNPIYPNSQNSHVEFLCRWDKFIQNKFIHTTQRSPS